MKLTRLSLALAALIAVAGLAYVAQKAEPPGAVMTIAAQRFLASLGDELKGQATIPFDSKERFNWNFVPLQDGTKSTRKGVPLEAMSAEQKKAALALLRSGTSEAGNNAAVTIMSLEAILREQETGGKMVRNPDWYFFTVFGTPSKTGKWGWRVEGHHLALNFTLDGTQVVASTPTFFGANPAEVKAGPKKGLRILASAEDLAVDLFNSLSDKQKEVALQKKPFGEPGQKTTEPKLGEPVGVAADAMTEAQKGILMKLLHAYTDRMPAEVAALEWKHVKDAGVGKIHFAYTRDAKGGKGHTYRVHGPTFVIEFLNVQNDSGGNPANHIHSCWRKIKGDFGL
ncbi:MAG: DUF3500 domain-containing protein [Gemmataceae bacterium]|nr:DUF3500 domain-containing protein [Gemmataceae bacterium]MCI0738056.1 DUF3500 domain-containing protein [Gemmataceae bacterium]